MLKDLRLKHKLKRAENAEYIGAERILDDKTDFETIESYKSIRTNIMFSAPKSQKGKVIVVTSSSPGEGKTTTSINLAITFAQMGAKVLLMDCDLRKSRVHRYLKLEREDGVTNVLCGFADFDKAVKKNVREHMDCITCGVVPPNPAELLESTEFTDLLESLKTKYDYIFVDTPPITVVTDAAIAIRQSMGVVVVIRQNITGYDLLDVAMSNINKAGVKVLGFVVLGTENKSKKYSYYSEGGYKKYRRNRYSYNDEVID